MDVETIEIDKDTTRVILSGKMDIRGAEVIALPLSVLSGSKRGLIIDMAAVTFLASIGIRHLVSAAKTLSSRNGRLVLLRPSDMIIDILKTSGLTDILPTASNEQDALTAVLS